MGVGVAEVTKPGNVALLMKQTLLPLLCPDCALERHAEGRVAPENLAGRLCGNGAVRYAVGSSQEQADNAVFRGGFLEAVDQLLAGDTTRRTLSALAYKANRHLVIEDAGAAGP